MSTVSVPPVSSGVKLVNESFEVKLKLILSVWTRNERVLVSFYDQVKLYLSCDDATERVKKSKLLCMYFRARYLGCSEEVDFLGLCFRGPFRRWMRSRMCFTRDNTHLWSTLFDAKSCAERVGDDYVEAELRKHAADVGRPDTATAADVAEAMWHLTPVIRQIRASVRCGDLDWAVRQTATEAVSGTASYHSPRRTGGLSGEVYGLIRRATRLGVDAQEGRLKWDCDERENWDPDTDVVTWDPRHPNDPTCVAFQVVDMHPPLRFPMNHPQEARYAPSRRLWEPTKPLDIRALRGVAVPVLSNRGWEWKSIAPSGYTYRVGAEEHTVRTGPDRKRHAKYLNSAETPAYGSPEYYDWAVETTDHLATEVVLYEVQAVDEERADYREIRDYPSMTAKFEALIKACYLLCAENPDRVWPVRVSPVTEPLKVRVITVDVLPVALVTTCWQKLVHGAMRHMPCFRLLGVAPDVTQLIDLERAEGDGWASSDFSGASNQTPAAWRDEIVRQLGVGMPDWFRVAGRVGSSSGFMVYPEKYEIPSVIQSRGTLMGRKTSFPTLSLQVLGVHLWSQAGRREPLRLKLDRVLVNGDDRVAHTTASEELEFWRLCGRLQFGKSLGKSYFHRTYANINSQSYHMGPAGAVKVGCLKAGLLTGDQKLAGKQFNPSTVISHLMATCRTATMQHVVLRLFLRRHGGLLRVTLGGRSLWAPCSVGGAGQTRPDRSPVYGDWRWNTDAEGPLPHLFAASVVARMGLVPRCFDERQCTGAWSFRRHPLDVTEPTSYWDRVRLVYRAKEGDMDAPWAAFDESDIDWAAPSLPRSVYRRTRWARPVPSCPSEIAGVVASVAHRPDRLVSGRQPATSTHVVERFEVRRDVCRAVGPAMPWPRPAPKAAPRAVVYPIRYEFEVLDCAQRRCRPAPPRWVYPIVLPRTVAGGFWWRCRTCGSFNKSGNDIDDLVCWCCGIDDRDIDDDGSSDLGGWSRHCAPPASELSSAGEWAPLGA